MIQKSLNEVCISAGYMNCVNALKRLRTEFYGDDSDQYGLIPSYLEQLNTRNHTTHLEIESGIFRRLCIIFRESRESYSSFAERGICVDGTFLKTSIGGILLIACFRNGNNEIQIIAIGIVCTENESNWTWFMNHVLQQLCPKPTFVISDRDKGLVQAMKTIDSQIPHFYCFRHLMENFNKKFKSSELKKLAWELAFARTERKYEAHAAKISQINKASYDWLCEVGREKRSSLYSPGSRFKTLTSNNVKSINSALKGVRSLPIIDCLMSIERYVGSKWLQSVTKAPGWGELTSYASKKADKLLMTAGDYQVTANSKNSFIVSREGPSKCDYYSVLFHRTNVVCSCGLVEDIGAPCVHVLVTLRHNNQLPEMITYYHKTWTTSNFVRAYAQHDDYVILPLTLKELLAKSECKPPNISKKRGRPKKKRILSQQSTAILEKSHSRKCGICQQVGHNKRTCNKEM